MLALLSVPQRFFDDDEIRARASSDEKNMCGDEQHENIFLRVHQRQPRAIFNRKDHIAQMIGGAATNLQKQNDALKKQVNNLKKQLDKTKNSPPAGTSGSPAPAAHPPASPAGAAPVHAVENKEGKEDDEEGEDDDEDEEGDIDDNEGPSSSSKSDEERVRDLTPKLKRKLLRCMNTFFCKHAEKGGAIDMRPTTFSDWLKTVQEDKVIEVDMEAILKELEKFRTQQKIEISR